MVDGPGALSGRTLGGYRLGARLARSPHAEVYRATDDDLGREVVIKLVPGGAASAAARERFVAEARVAARIDHPYATHVYASGVEPDGTCWMAMEWVRGATLAERVARHGPLRVDEAVELAGRLAEVVSTLHDQGLVHLDLKPDNILLVSRGGRLLPRLCDFGLAAVPLDGPAGTPAYMAPEQWRLGDASAPAVGPRTDVYALAACLQFALTGTHAFGASPPSASPSPASPPSASPSPASPSSASSVSSGSIAALAAAHASPGRPRLPPTFPAALADALGAALAIDPAARPASALELATALRAAIDARARPRFDDAVVEAVLGGAPEPIAEAMAAWEAALSPRAELEALDELHAITARWLGLCAIALRRTHGAPPAGSVPRAEVSAALAALARGALSPAAWLSLARDDAPVDDLATDLARAARLASAPPLDSPPGGSLAVIGDERISGPPERAATSGSPERAATSGSPERAAQPRVEGPPVDEVDRRITAALVAVQRLLRAASSVITPRLAVRRGARVERWSGVRRRKRPAIWVANVDTLVDGVPTLVDEQGAPLVALDGLAMIDAPAAGEPDELFVLAAGDRDATIFVATPAGYQRRVAGPPLGLAVTTAARDEGEERGPYPGLAPFTSDDAAWFVGREREVEDCANKLRDRPLLVVVGPSGVGKSSFALAGVAPASGARHVVVCRPGESPAMSLLAALGAAIDAPDRVRAAVERVERLAVEGRVLIVIDQLEEAATRAPAAEAAALGAIIDELAGLAARGVDVRVLATVRDDFLVRTATATRLEPRLAAGVVLLGPPDTAALERIVTEPAARAGYAFDDPGLPSEMVAAVAGAASPLPLLSFAARALWSRRDRKLRQLRRRDHDAIGGVLGALARHADETVDAMDRDARALVRPLLASLATAEGARVPVARAELIELLGGGAAAAQVVERLVDARLLVSRQPGDLARALTDAGHRDAGNRDAGNRDNGSRDNGSRDNGSRDNGRRDADEIELVHEALLEAWPRLASWRRDDAVAAQLRDSIRSAAQQWDARGRGRDLLWRGEALDELRVWRRRHAVRLTARDEAFCQASLREDRRRRRLVRGAMIAGALAAALAMIVLVRANREARSQRAAATTARASAVQSADAARARLIDSLVEQGRTAALDDRPREALAWLDAAISAGADPAPLDRLISITAAALGDDRARPILRTPVHVMTWSPSGEHLAAGGRNGDGRVVVLDRSGAVTAELPDRGATVTDLAFAPPASTRSQPGAPSTAAQPRTPAMSIAMPASPGRTAAAGEVPRLAIAAGRARVWEPGGTAPPVELPGDAARVRWSPDGTRLATAGRDGVVRIFVAPRWDAPAAEIGPRDGVRTMVSVAWIDEERVVVGDRQRGLRLHDAQRGRLLVERMADAPVLDLVVREGRVLSLPFDAAIADLWEPDRGRSWALAGQRRPLDAVASDGRSAAAGGGDGTVMVWDLEHGRLTGSHAGHRGGVSALGFLGGTPISGGVDGTVRAWHAATAIVRHAHPVTITAMAVTERRAPAPAQRTPVTDHTTVEPSPMVATGAADGTIALWGEAELAGPAATYRYDQATALVVDGDRWITVAPGRVEAWPARRVLPAVPAQVGEGPLRVSHRVDAGRSDDGRLVVPSGNEARVIDRAGAVIGSCPLREPVTTVAISRDGARVAAGSHGGIVAVCRVPASRPPAGAVDHGQAPLGDHQVLPERAGAVWALAFSPDGTHLAIGGADPEVTLADLTHHHVATARLGAGATSLAWTDAGDHVAAATLDGGLALVARDATVAVALPGSGTQANAVAILDDRHVAIGLDDGTVTLVSRDLGRPIARWSVGAAVLAFASGAPRGRLIAVTADRAVELPLGTSLAPAALHRLVRCRARVEVRGGRLVQAAPDCT